MFGLQGGFPFRGAPKSRWGLKILINYAMEKMLKNIDIYFILFFIFMYHSGYADNTGC